MKKGYFRTSARTYRCVAFGVLWEYQMKKEMERRGKESDEGEEGKEELEEGWFAENELLDWY
jgi:hypothetical protein